MKRSLAIRTLLSVSIFILVVSLLFVWPGVLSAAPGDIVRCSTDSTETQGNGHSSRCKVSSDGRYIAFESEASNLVSGDSNATWDVFRKDLQTGAIVRCSTDSSGTQSNGPSYTLSISADGRYVAFMSQATNLVSPATSSVGNIFRKDLQTGTTVLCSSTSGGVEGNALSGSPSISSDGRYVAFESDANNLLGPGGDTNTARDVFRKDLQTAAIVRCSTDSSWGEGNSISFGASISSDGRYVALYSYASNLITGDTNSTSDVFRKDAQSGTIVRCSTDSADGQANSSSITPSLSPDGRYVAFDSAATNLVSGDTNGMNDIFRKDLQTGAIVRCSTASGGSEGNANSSVPSIGADTRYVAFASDATNLVSGDTNGFKDVFRKDIKTGAIVRCSTSSGGTQGDNDSDGPSINGDGKYVLFYSVATTLVSGDTNGVSDVFRKELALPLPTIASITPDEGEVGDTVTIAGTEFGNSRGSSYVSFGSTQASDYISWSDTKIKVKVPEGVSGKVDVTVTTSIGTSNAKDFTVPEPPPAPATTTTFYFAEGYTGTGFDEWLCLGNPEADPVDVEVTYLFTDGSTQVQSYTVPGLSRTTVDVNSSVGLDKDVSIKCEADSPFVAERPMYFNYQGVWTGGHDCVGATRTSTTWYFAEGYTGPGFDEWICVLNPGDTDAALTFRFQTQEEGEKTVGGLSVPAHSRQTFKANVLLGGYYQTSLALESSQPVVAERPMYFNYQGTNAWNWTGGHCVMGVPELDNEYYFAEGYTGASFEEWLTLQNPGTAPIDIQATYMLGTGETVDVTYPVAAGERHTAYVPTEVGLDQDVSIYLTSSSLFLAERPMYFNYQGTNAWGWTGGHCVIGTTESAQDWFFAEGYTGTGFEEWLCIQNPEAVDAEVTITYYPSGGAPIVKEPFIVVANSRHTVYVNGDAGPNLPISAWVASDQPVIVERPMYFNYKGLTGGHDVVGYAP